MSLREKKTSAALPISPSVVMEHHLKQMAHNVLHPYSPLCMVLPFANLKLLYHPSKVKQQTHQTCKRVNTFCFWTYIGSNIIHLQKLKTKCHKSYQDSDKSWCKRSLLSTVLIRRMVRCASPLHYFLV